ncbi:hypothetical protein [Coleofasciculus sp.]|uniref:hypothetical protein n=1 Tax=Coleofasciculus sp. TaxID=3100458 RepID=UPI0039F929FF
MSGNSPIRITAAPRKESGAWFIGIDVIIATTDTEDFNRLLKQHHIKARRWKDIKPGLNS